MRVKLFSTLNFAPFISVCVAVVAFAALSACASYPGTTHSGAGLGINGIDDSEFEVIQITPDLVRSLNGSAQSISSKKAIKQPKYTYKIGAGDELIVTVMVQGRGNDGLISYQRIYPSSSGGSGDEPMLVNESGKLLFPHIGELKVAGKGIGQVQSELHKKFSTYFKLPQVTVRLKNSNSAFANVTGEVEEPVELALGYQPISVVEAIQKAGGVKKSGDLENAYILKKDGKRVAIDLLALLHKGKQAYNYTLFDGDTLHIPDNHKNQVVVLGEVIRPGVHSIEGGKLSLAGILAESSGLNLITAAEAEIYVMRPHDSPHSDGEYAANAEGFANIYQLDARSPKAFAVADHFLLQPRDVVYVSTSAITEWSRFINQVLPNAVTTLTDPRRYED